MMTDNLSMLFGSEGKVKIMRLFLFNPYEGFDMDMISKKTKVSAKSAKKEISVLEKAHLIKRKAFYKTTLKKVKGKAKEIKKRTKGYYLNPDFLYVSALRQLLMNDKNLEGGEIIKRLSKAGKLKFVIISGVFIQHKDSRVDLLVVGNNINKSKLSKIIKSMEAEIGKEITYAFFETPDFQYRLGMYDKLIRDIMDYPHQVLLDNISS